MKINKIFFVIFFITNLIAFDITTGSPTGTYIKFGQQIKKYVAQPINMSMNVISSNGSVDNIKKLTKKENIRFAIVQHDVINVFKNSNNSELKLLVRNIKVMLPLYYEEIHIVVRKNSPMTYFKDLKNTRINIGKRGSGTAMTSVLLYRELFSQDISQNNIFTYSDTEALDKLKNNQIDAVVIVSGQPSGIIKNLDSQEFKLLKRDKHTTSKIYYDKVKIKSSSYSWLNYDVPTFAVKAYLIVYDDSSKKFENQIRDFAIQFRKQLDILKRYGHPKWKNVKEELPNVLPGGWEYYEPFKDAWKYAKCTQDEQLMGLCE